MTSSKLRQLWFCWFLNDIAFVIPGSYIIWLLYNIVYNEQGSKILCNPTLIPFLFRYRYKRTLTIQSLSISKPINLELRLFVLYESIVLVKGSRWNGLSFVSTLNDKCYLWASSMCHCTWYRLGSRSHSWYCRYLST